MLARTADNLYWFARYVERADHVARIIEATSRLAALPRAYGGATSEWESALISSGVIDEFAKTGREINEANAKLQVEKTSYLVNVNQDTIKIVQENSKQVAQLTNAIAVLTEAIRGGQRSHK